MEEVTCSDHTVGSSWNPSLCRDLGNDRGLDEGRDFGTSAEEEVMGACGWARDRGVDLAVDAIAQVIMNVKHTGQLSKSRG